MSKSFYVACPYCGQKLYTNYEDCLPKIKFCDPEDGGCGKYLVYQVFASYEVNARKIEGELI